MLPPQSISSDSTPSPLPPTLPVVEGRARMERLLSLALELSEVFVLSGLLKLSPVELRMRMEPGGTLKQGLRLGECLHGCG